MSESIQLNLLGPMQIVRGDTAVSLTSAKARALLAYLALNPQPQPRPALATLLWGDKPDSAALANLRMALTQIRKALPGALIVTRTTAALADHITAADVAALTAVYTQLQKQGITTETVAAAETAVDHYRGECLAGLHLNDAPVFESWLLLERERLQQMALDVWSALVDFALTHNRPRQGIAHARRLLALAPWREDVHRALMRLLAANGQPAAALAHFDTCRQAVAEELGVEPAAETVALVAAIRDERQGGKGAGGQGREPIASLPPRPAAPRHNLPAATTPFIGREAELAQIGELLTDPACRLLTLVGPGGMGKTRLALAAAQQAVDSDAGFADGVWFVALAGADTAVDLSTAIANVLDLTLSGGEETAVQLQNHLRHQKLLLILDNFEQLAPTAPLLSDWLSAAPGLTLLVTSRAPLRLVEEWLLDVAGLPVPDAKPDAAIGAFPSVQLFVQRARRVNLGFELAAEQQAVAEICQLVAGMPLALEMAAAWVRTFACADIASALRQNLDWLTSQARNRPQRQQSLRAVFTYSWRLLNAEEQQALSRLTVFHGGFTAAAGQAVAAAEPRTLASLVEKSLVQRATNGRYHLHPLLRQFAAEKLDAPLDAAHARYFSAQLAEKTAVLRGPEPETAVAALLPDSDNVRVAWRWLADNGETAAIDRALLALFELYDARSWYVEGEQLLAQVTADDERLAARLAALRARFLTRQGQLAAAETLVQASLPVLRQGDAREYGDALNNLNNILRRNGRYDAALAALTEAQQVYEAAGFQRGVASVLNNCGLAAYRQGAYATAVDLQQRSADLYRQTGPRKDLATVLNNLGLSRLYAGELAAAEAALRESAETAAAIGYHACLVVATQNLGAVAAHEQEWADAERHLQHSLELAQAVGVNDMAGHIHNDLSVIYLRWGKLAAAQEHGEAALALAQARGMQWLEASAQDNLAEMALAQHAWAEAERRLRAGLALALGIGAEGLLPGMLANWGQLLTAQGDVETALRLLAVAVPLLDSEPQRREMAVALQNALRKRVGSERWRELKAEAQGKTVVALSADILG